MNAFEHAAKTIARHWNYLLIYTVALGVVSLLGPDAPQVPQTDES